MKRILHPREVGRFTGKATCFLLTAAVFLSTTGCHSAFIDATLVNHSDHEVRLVEIDYPSASFGTQTLAPGAMFHYRFKVIGEGPVKLSWTDSNVNPKQNSQQKDHTAEGPSLHEGQEGSLNIAITNAEPQWRTQLHSVSR